MGIRILPVMWSLVFHTGSIDTSILVVPGVHARLENISQAGTWILTEVFELAGVEHRHEAGQPVGNIMQSWRKQRQEQPELFRGLLVWQSPTAFVDSVIWAWQQKEEGRHGRRSAAV